MKKSGNRHQPSFLHLSQAQSKLEESEGRLNLLKLSIDQREREMAAAAAVAVVASNGAADNSMTSSGEFPLASAPSPPQGKLEG